MKNSYNIPNVCKIIITGDVQCGKSIVLDRIKKMLKNEFKSNSVIINSGHQPPEEYGDLAKWQKDMVKETVFILLEEPKKL